MRHADYLDGLRVAFLGEIAGAALARSFAKRDLAPRERKICGMIERLETMTADILTPLLAAPPSGQDIALAISRGEASGRRLRNWAALVDHAAHALDRYVDEFTLLRDVAPDNDHAVLDLLVSHEIALRDFGKEALAGQTDGSKPLRIAIAATEHHLVARG